MPYYQRFLDYLDFGDSRQSTDGSRQSTVGSQQSAVRVHSPSSIPDPRSSILHNPKILSLKSWPIPVRTQKGDFHSGRALVVGDAAGLTDSLTGEGIYYAVRSGKLAAKACASFLQGQTETLGPYSDQVNDDLMTELLEGNKIKHIFNTVPLKIHYFVRDNDRAWSAFGKVLQGERSYKDVKLGFGKWKVVWNLVSFLSGYFERIKTYRYKKKT